MLYLTALFLLSVILFISTRKKLGRNFAIDKSNYGVLEAEYKSALAENERIEKENSNLGQSVRQTVALYDITKDICKSLEEDAVFNIFKERINKYMRIGDCKYFKGETQVEQNQGDTVLPLMIQRNNIGYLVASGVREADMDKFHILSQQFLLGIKRALLYKKVQELIITDSLTQVYSRRYFLGRFQEEMERSKKFNLNLSFLMVDIDHFKECNDHYGHLVGDAVLREISKTIKESIRQMDFMGRYGGEELSIVLSETDKEQAGFAAERIRQAIEERQIRVYDEDLKVTISIGISTFPDDAKDVQTLIDKSDQALYLAKQSGRNKFCIYQSQK